MTVLNYFHVDQLLLCRDVDWLDLMRDLDGCYECPKRDGKRQGPLVGYAGTDEQGRAYVGDVYVNFAKAENWDSVLTRVARNLKSGIWNDVDTVCGMPLGGLALAQKLAGVYNKRYVYLEKKVLQAKTETSREKSDLIFNRHEIRPGETVALVEDVANNFSTTAKAVQRVQEAGGQVRGVFCFLNRSLKFDYSFQVGQLTLPIITLVRKPIDQWSQDDPEVAADVAAGNVVWKPKDEWDRLKKAMEAA